MTEEENKEYGQLKDHIKQRCNMIISLCDGACMCSDNGRPLYEFSNNIKAEMRRIISEVHNFAFICED